MNDTIERLREAQVDWISKQIRRLQLAKPGGYFHKCFEAQERGEMVVFIARAEEQLHGYLKIVWKSDYPPFRDRGIPEIQDLYVAPESRRKGIATRLMNAAERIIARRSSIIGIGVGLHPGYAAAQRMYVLRGYVPDAMPATYRNRFVTEGQNVSLDDDLILHLVKKISD